MHTVRTTGVFVVAALLLVSSASVGFAAATVPATALNGPAEPTVTGAPAASDSPGNGSVVSAHGGAVYLVFGADTGGGDLQSWVDAHRSEIQSAASRPEASTQVFQYQNVSQVNLNHQENATAIAIDGGRATAVQASSQQNANSQQAFARAGPTPGPSDTQFRNVGTVYVVFAGDRTGYSGWVLDNPSQKARLEHQPRSTARVTQHQDANQSNANNQTRAIAIAEDASNATAVQLSRQRNVNLQSAEALASLPGALRRNASVAQWQNVTQENDNAQECAVAIAVGEGSTAFAAQLSYQENQNRQVANATATGFGGMSFAAFVDSTGIPGDYSSADLHVTSGNDASHVRSATVNVTQEQHAAQTNVNVQRTAMAVALNGSEALSMQSSYQGNFNAQLAYATAAFLPGRTTLTASADYTAASGGDSWALTHLGASGQRNVGQLTAEVSQTQYVFQQNYDVQNGSVAFANNGGNATATQLNYQTNTNVQIANATARA